VLAGSDRSKRFFVSRLNHVGKKGQDRSLPND